MFEKITQLAEAAATQVSQSRRGFLGRLGQGALAVGALLAGFVTPARAGQGVVCCKYVCHYYKPYHRTISVGCLPAGSTCPPPYSHCNLSQSNGDTCAKCYGG
jgi:hypothetical protein